MIREVWRLLRPTERLAVIVGGIGWARGRAGGRLVTLTIPEHSLKRDRAIRFGRELERAMKARGVGARTLAEAGTAARNTVRSWRDGRNLPRLETARRLAQALDWPRLEELAVEARTKRCLVDAVEFIDDSGSDNRLYCTEGCRDVAGMKLVGVDRRARAAIAERRLKVHQDAVAAYCGGCEPSGRCVTADCPLRPVSPLKLYDSLLDLEPVQPKPHNGYRGPGADRARMLRTWARYTPEEKAARITRAAEASKRARGLVPA